jgi:hypothetical protein
MFDYCARRESENLKVSFGRAKAEGDLGQFYDLLAMHQLLTVPKRSLETRRGSSAIFPKLICLLPLIAQGLVVGHDIYTDPTSNTLDLLHNKILLGIEAFWLILLCAFCFWTMRHLFEIDRTWDSWAEERFERSEPQDV